MAVFWNFFKVYLSWKKISEGLKNISPLTFLKFLKFLREKRKSNNHIKILTILFIKVLINKKINEIIIIIYSYNIKYYLFLFNFINKSN